MALIPALVVLVPVMLGTVRAADENDATSCQVPHALVEDDPRLPVTAGRLKARQPLRIVTIGGASTAGIAAGGDGANSYPARLEAALGRRHPGIAITVLNKAIPRQTTADMARHFARDVVPAHPDLVIWETGTVDAVRGVDVDEFASALASGVAALRQHKLDVMLVNMQYNPDTGSVIDFEPYLLALNHEADLDDVYLFDRYEIMKFWSDTGVFDLVDVPKDRRVSLARAVYRCLGEALAEAIDHGAR